MAIDVRFLLSIFDPNLSEFTVLYVNAFVILVTLCGYSSRELFFFSFCSCLYSFLLPLVIYLLRKVVLIGLCNIECTIYQLNMLINKIKDLWMASELSMFAYFIGSLGNRPRSSEILCIFYTCHNQSQLETMHYLFLKKWLLFILAEV